MDIDFSKSAVLRNPSVIAGIFLIRHILSAGAVKVHISLTRLSAVAGICGQTKNGTDAKKINENMRFKSSTEPPVESLFRLQTGHQMDFR